MKRTFAILLIFLSCWQTMVSADPIPATGSVEVFFSPNGGCTDAIVREINHAKKEILILAYSFTSKPIAKAILDAKKRGVSVVAVLDKSQRRERYTAATFLANQGIPVFIDDRHAIMHNKVIIVDRSVLLTGSFNFSSGAENKNAENLLVMKGNQHLVDQYQQNFEQHRGHSQPYIGRLP